jgi:preprotein translocase subunit SecF
MYQRAIQLDKPALKQSLMNFWDKHYKKLLMLTFILLALSFAQIGYQIYSTGDFMSKGVSLKGGVTVTIEKAVDNVELQNYLTGLFPKSDASVKTVSKGGQVYGVIVEASDIEGDVLVSKLKEKLELKDDEFSAETMGSSLGESFFKETFRIIILAFLFMAIIVFMYFGDNLKSKIIAVLLTAVAMPVIYISTNATLWVFSVILIVLLFYVYYKYSIPSFAVILCAFSDMIVTLAIVNLLGMKIGTAGIAAFLMMIGYSVDTDILLSTKVLKRKGVSVTEATFDAMKTGLMMSATTIIATVLAFMFAESEILKQIMLIVSIGLIVDLPNTWIQNGGLLKWYFEHKHKAKEHEQN